MKKEEIKLPKKYISMKNNIIQLLKNKGNYEDVDEYTIDEIVFNSMMADNAKLDILKNGQMVNVVRKEDKEPLYQANQSVGIYHQCLKQINSMYTKLGISPSERKKLKLNTTQETNEDHLSNFIDGEYDDKK